MTLCSRGMFVGQSWTDRVRHFFCLMKSKLIWNLHKNSEMWNIGSAAVQRRCCCFFGKEECETKRWTGETVSAWWIMSVCRATQYAQQGPRSQRECLMNIHIVRPGVWFCFSSVTSQNQDNEGKQRRKRALHINTKGVDRTISFVFGDLLEASVCRGIFVCWLVTRYTWIKSH